MTPPRSLQTLVLCSASPSEHRAFRRPFKALLLQGDIPDGQGRPDSLGYG